jgi:cytochrome c2
MTRFSAPFFYVLLCVSYITVGAEPSQRNDDRTANVEYGRAVLAQRGEPARGERLYDDATRTRCKACHAIEGRGNTLGPDLRA